MKKLVKVDEEGARRAGPKRTTYVPSEEGELATCDVAKEKRWTMNMDSTLKQKDYRKTPTE